MFEFLSTRGGGETSFLRTESDVGSGQGTETGSKTVKSDIPGAARPVTSTPGKEILEKLLLSRVFGAAI